jgi:isopentenyl-diphosphate delta-isomerase
VQEHTEVDLDVLLLHGGSMEHEFERFDSRIIGGGDSRLWMLQRGLTNMNLDRVANGLAFARQAPLMWARREAPIFLLNSLGSLPVLRFLPKSSSSTFVLYVHELDDSFNRTLGSAAWDLLSPRVDHFLTCGSMVTEMLVERKGVDPARITEHPGFVDPPVDATEGGLARRRAMGIADDAFVVGGSGRPEWRKGPELMIRAARTLLDRRPDLDVHFVWMGGPVDDSPGFKMLHDIRAAGLEDRFHLLGEVDEPDEAQAMMDVFALTSREDPFPLVMLEAANVGIPVVSFANGGVVEFSTSAGPEPIAEVVPYLNVGAMVDVLARLADEPDQRRALGARAKAQVQAHHLTEVAAPRLLATLAGVEPRLAARLAAGGPTAASLVVDLTVAKAGPTPSGPWPSREGQPDVVLVDEDDAVVGAMGKVDAHLPPGHLHRAISAVVFDDEGRLILQRRAATKYHFADRWSNTCCTHPLPGEDPVTSGERRLLEEVGFTCRLEPAGRFRYRAEDEDSGLVEHEVDHVLVGVHDGPIDPNPAEVSEIRRLTLDEALAELDRSPDAHTPWLRSVLEIAGRWRSGAGHPIPDASTADRPLKGTP